MFLLEYSLDSKAKRLFEAPKIVCVKPVPGNHAVASVKITIATVKSLRPPLPSPFPPKKSS